MAAAQLGGASEGWWRQVGHQRAVTCLCRPITKQKKGINICSHETNILNFFTSSNASLWQLSSVEGNEGRRRSSDPDQQVDPGNTWLSDYSSGFITLLIKNQIVRNEEVFFQLKGAPLVPIKANCAGSHRTGTKLKQVGFSEKTFLCLTHSKA